MTKIKLCGLSRPCDIAATNELNPEYIGFVFVPKSKRYITPQKAKALKQLLNANTKAVGVFVNEDVKTIADLLNQGIIDIVQLHGAEDEDYIKQLRILTDKPIIKAIRIESEKELVDAECCSADCILLDSGAGTGTVFNWKLIQNVNRPYFLAGGLTPDNVENAISMLHPYAVDVSSGIETDGLKDKTKMAAFTAAVRKEEKI
ncbi:phosphoribosylanthranilate isomerase [Peptoniphilus equinus]|uniref:N-(5'-phosphoribosyl)anthranilate isomerase n=1 Tax=Peptoniphilus equinus TaxID=3016343 RepID=A0ABY7QV08_9FIRM|nr:phosphoribosylanthranilate isomerase [Peptoniphilus equinus]WBW50018.1 phosphoribosylanthranilate isomerase [Peptoniphilus equinus]